MIRQPVSMKRKMILGAASILFMLAFYSYLSWRQYQLNPKNTIMPSLLQIIHTTTKLVTPDSNGKIWLLQDSIATFSRLGIGMFFGVTISCVIGIGMGCFRSMEAFFEPSLTFLTRLPATAMLAVFLILVGHGETMFATMIAFGVIPTLTMAIFNAAKFDVHDESVYKAYTIGASTPEAIWNVVTQQILPRIIESVRLQVGPAMVLLLAAEFSLGDVGFGYRLRIQGSRLHMDVIYNYLIILGAWGFLIDYALLKTRNLVSPWFARNN